MNASRRLRDRGRSRIRCVCEMLEPRVLLSSAVVPATAFAAAVTPRDAQMALTDSFDDDWDNSGSWWDDPEPAPPSTQPDTQPDTQPWPEPSPEPSPWPEPPPDWSNPYVPPVFDDPGDDTPDYDPGTDEPAYPVFFPPATPTRLNAVPLSATKVRLTWRGDTFNADGFRILRIGPAKTCTVIACVSGDTTSFIDTHVRGDTTYTYAVSAFNSAGNSGYSRTATVHTPVSVQPPVGCIDVADGSVVRGWVVDPDTPWNGVVVSATLDGAAIGGKTAAEFRPDLVRTYGSAGHGFTLKLPTLSAGIHRVEIFATDTATGKRTRIGARVIDRPTTGFLDRVNASRIAGWAFDADRGTAPLQIRYTIDRQRPRFALAATPRSDLVAHVGSANHGFVINLPKLTAGAHLVTVVAIDPVSGKVMLLGKRWVYAAMHK